MATSNPDGHNHQSENQYNIHDHEGKRQYGHNHIKRTTWFLGKIIQYDTWNGQYQTGAPDFK